MSETATKRDVEMLATVSIIGDYKPLLDRVTGPDGDKWRQQAYNLHTEDDVLDHWASNAIANGVVDVCQLDGWADVPAETVTFQVWDVVRDG